VDGGVTTTSVDGTNSDVNEESTDEDTDDEA